MLESQHLDLVLINFLKSIELGTHSPKIFWVIVNSLGEELIRSLTSVIALCYIVFEDRCKPVRLFSSLGLALSGLIESLLMLAQVVD